MCAERLKDKSSLRYALFPHWVGLRVYGLANTCVCVSQRVVIWFERNSEGYSGRIKDTGQFAWKRLRIHGRGAAK